MYKFTFLLIEFYKITTLNISLLPLDFNNFQDLIFLRKFYVKSSVAELHLKNWLYAQMGHTLFNRRILTLGLYISHIAKLTIHNDSCEK